MFPHKPARDFILKDTPTSWGSNLNIVKDPPKSYFTKKFNKVDLNIIQKFNEDQTRFDESILNYQRNVDPFKQIQKANNTTLQGQAIRTKVINEYDVLPLSKQPFQPFEFSSKKSNASKKNELDKQHISEKTFNKNNTILSILSNKKTKGEDLNIGKIDTKLHDTLLYNILSKRKKKQRLTSLENLHDLNSHIDNKEIFKNVKSAKKIIVHKPTDVTAKKLKDEDLIELYTDKKYKKLQELNNSIIHMENTTAIKNKDDFNLLSNKQIKTNNPEQNSVEIISKINDDLLSFQLKGIKNKSNSNKNNTIDNQSVKTKIGHDVEIKGYKNLNKVNTEQTKVFDKNSSINKNYIEVEQISKKKTKERHNLHKINFSKNKHDNYILNTTILAKKSKMNRNKALFDSLRTDLEYKNKFNNLTVNESVGFKVTKPKTNDNLNILLKKRNSD